MKICTIIIVKRITNGIIDLAICLLLLLLKLIPYEIFIVRSIATQALSQSPTLTKNQRRQSIGIHCTRTHKRFLIEPICDAERIQNLIVNMIIVIRDVIEDVNIYRLQPILRAFFL